jgi:hypothetical protein
MRKRKKDVLRVVFNMTEHGRNCLDFFNCTSNCSPYRCGVWVAASGEWERSPFISRLASRLHTYYWMTSGWPITWASYVHNRVSPIHVRGKEDWGMCGE